MKKLLTLLMVAGIFSLVACGPTQEEKAVIEEAADQEADAILEDAMNSIEETVTPAEDHDDENRDHTEEEEVEG